MMELQLTVNGQDVQATVPADMTLLQFLRDHLGLTGTKNGCGQGHCGTCTVIMDGRAVRACVVRVKRASGRQIETIEGLSEEGQLHPIQQAFATQGAIQCGFCTPGLLMVAKALLDRNLHPSDDEIRKALEHNLCRCAAYSKILAAVRQAAMMLADPSAPAVPLTPGGADPVGRSVVRKDALSKVTGQTKYAADMSLPGMLHGKVLWSPVPHARILGVDSSSALGLPGVRAILTAGDVPGTNRFGLIAADQPVLADTRVRFLGDAVAVVFADSPQQAAAAVDALRVDYEELPLVLDPAHALADGAPQLHEDGNLLDHASIRIGDAAAGFAEAEVVVEGTYTTPQVEHAYLEPEAALAAVGADDQVTIWTGTHEPAKIQIQVAAALGLPDDRVRVVHVPTGGAFGSKHDVLLQIFVALGSVKTGRPVKMVLSRAESLRAHPKRHAFTMHYRTGARRDGTITAMSARLVGDAGAYASESLPVMRTALGAACGCYHVPSAALDSYAVYTNNATAGAMRGFGIPQAIFAVEVQMDRLARELGLSPFELRLRNGLDLGGRTSTGQVLREPTAFPECLRVAERAAQNLAQLPPPAAGWRRGVGVAAGIKPTGLGYGRDPGAGAVVEITPAGDILVRVGGVELGQGLETMAAQVAAQTLQVDYEQVRVIVGDTQEAPFGGPTIASRQTYVTGSAVYQASLALRERITEHIAETFDLPREMVLFRNGVFLNLQSEEAICTLQDLPRLARERDWSLREQTHYMPPETYALGEQVPAPAGRAAAPVGRATVQGDTHFSLSFSVQVAVVDVNEETGSVDVITLILVHDVGRAVHPQNVEAQLEGGAIMGMGYALSEAYRAYEPDATTTLRRCKVPSIGRAPEVAVLLVEQDSMVGPSRGKAVGETGVVPTAPAIINAIYDAVGVRIVDLPATAAKVRAALGSAASSSCNQQN